MKSSTGQHFLALDHIRAVAAFLVFSWHFTHGSKGDPAPFTGAPTIAPLAIFDEGHTGVALFMVLSGYLFAKLLDGKTINYPAFLWNRALRLLPLMAFAVMITGIINEVGGGSTKEYLKSVLWGAVRPSLPNGGWSITVEAHFYLLLPFLLLASRRFRAAPLIFIAIAIVFRAALFLWLGQVQDLAYWTIVGRIDQFVLGIGAFYVGRHMKERHVLAAAVALAFSLFYWTFDRSGGFYELAGYPSKDPIWIVLGTVEGLAFGCLIAWYDTSFTPKNTGLSRAIGLAGAYSYSIYLLHFFLVFDLAQLIDTSVMSLSNWYVAQLWAIPAFALMIPIGWISFRYIEEPFLQLRRRYVTATVP